MPALRKLESPAVAIAFAAIVTLAGAALMGIASGAIPYDNEKLTAPRWLLFLVGSMFAAIAPVPLASVFPRFAPLARVAGPYSGAVLLLLVHWVAFGPGERAFSAGGAPVGSAPRPPVSEGMGRMWFGAIALALDALVVWSLVRAPRERWWRSD
jgi:hypothetical protein